MVPPYHPGPDENVSQICRSPDGFPFPSGLRTVGCQINFCQACSLDAALAQTPSAHLWTLFAR